MTAHAVHHYRYPFECKDIFRKSDPKRYGVTKNKMLIFLTKFCCLYAETIVVFYKNFFNFKGICRNCAVANTVKKFYVFAHQVEIKSDFLFEVLWRKIRK
ncbi:hypothetical protein [Chromatium okenii]|uniref:hypothetical protein n=1 Tax=Chromatium okenii TaxID=61644 RepID=UPI001A936D4F|nr:hypothetical protein [Chromatium okenii]